MNVERLAQFRNAAMNLSDSSTVADYKNLATLLFTLYKEEMPEVLTGATSPTLAAELAAADVDLASAVAEFSERTETVTK